jgi:DNA helicase-2/ATP-dependent DNA helicase PcrA
MAEDRIGLEPEVRLILQCIDKKQNFLLSGGAGSGKTYSLVQVIRQVIKENPASKVACMTYTNAAVKEIEERVDHPNLNVSTIHDFLWDCIKHFQNELKAIIIELANLPEVKGIKIESSVPIPETYFRDKNADIQYKEYLKLSEGIISHDELLIVANSLFSRYTKLCDIIKDKFRYIFIDEYQDTDKLVIEIFLKFFSVGEKVCTLGFFGDAMQAIYDDGIGDLDEFKGEGPGKVKEIKKEQNRRNPFKVIALANKLRSDGLTQTASTDSKAPNMQDGNVKQGQNLFLYSQGEDIDKVRAFLTKDMKWTFENSKTTKELNLTHNLIAGKAGFRTLMDIYDKDPIIGLKRDILEKIKKNKEEGKQEIEIKDDDTFDQVVDRFQLKNRSRELKKDILLKDHANVILYNQLKDKRFMEVKAIYLNKDSLIDDKKQDVSDESKKGSKRDNLVKHLFKIERNISLYSEAKFNEFLRATDYIHKLKTIKDKQELKDNIEKLILVGDKTIEDIIADADKMGICLIDDKLTDFKAKNEYLYNRVKMVQYSEFQKLFKYLEGQTPFSTQHKTKGTEFDNVLVILDNGKWNDFNFEYLFTNRTDKESVLKRTQKIFYVCCTRAKERLAVFYSDPSSDVIKQAKSWFGDDSVISI